MKKDKTCRVISYLAGLLILAFGIILNTKTGLGVSPIISVAFVVSTILNANFGNMTFLWYAAFVLVEILLHIVMSKRSEESGKNRVKNLKKAVAADVLQIPLSIMITRFMNLFSVMIPEFETDCAGTFAGSFAGRLLLLILAIVLTGIGAALSLDMRIVPNPGDGIVQALSDFFGKNVGFVKNCFDTFCICLTIALSFICAGHVIGIGVGTVLAVIGVGRVIALVNYMFLGELNRIAGIKEGSS